MFEATFRLGGYPMAAIDWMVEQLGNLVRGNMAEGPLKDLVVDGIIVDRRYELPRGPVARASWS